MKAHSLKDRLLWADGSSTVQSKDIGDYLSFVDTGKIFVDELTSDIEAFNKMTVNKITVKDENDPINTDWVIPDTVLSVDIKEHLDKKLINEIELQNFTEDEIISRVNRLDEEYSVMEKEKLIPVLYAILYIINTFVEKNIVWGVGRGSSTSSYALYLMGIHDVDSVKYDLDFFEFIH